MSTCNYIFFQFYFEDRIFVLFVPFPGHCVYFTFLSMHGCIDLSNASLRAMELERN